MYYILCHRQRRQDGVVFGGRRVGVVVRCERCLAAGRVRKLLRKGLCGMGWRGHLQTREVLARVAVDVVDGAVGGDAEGGCAVDAGHARAAGARGRAHGGALGDARESDGGCGNHFDVYVEGDMEVGEGKEKKITRRGGVQSGVQCEKSSSYCLPCCHNTGIGKARANISA